MDPLQLLTGGLEMGAEMAEEAFLAVTLLAAEETAEILVKVLGHVLGRFFLIGNAVVIVVVIFRCIINWVFIAKVLRFHYLGESANYFSRAGAAICRRFQI